MEMFRLSVTMNNAAFEDTPMSELARILRKLASRFEAGHFENPGSVFDANGNTVGEFAFTKS